jgi:hypothetical protein
MCTLPQCSGGLAAFDTQSNKDTRGDSPEPPRFAGAVVSVPPEQAPFHDLPLGLTQKHDVLISQPTM